MTRVPVYMEINGLHQVSIYEEQDDGTFRRTTEQPMRLLRDNIQGIGPAVGEMMASRFDRSLRVWSSPTVVYMGRPYSLYQFLREQISRRKLFVFTKPSLSGRLMRLQVHELQLKSTASSQVYSLLARKYTEAIELQPERELTLVEASGSGAA